MLDEAKAESGKLVSGEDGSCSASAGTPQQSETEVIRRWVNGPLRQRLRDHDWLVERLGVLKFGIDKGDAPVYAAAIFVGAVVLAAAEVDPGLELWVPVAERLPDDEIVVLIHLPGRGEQVWMGYHEEDEWFSHDGYRLAEDAVTHWMPLPFPPAETEAVPPPQSR